MPLFKLTKPVKKLMKKNQDEKRATIREDARKPKGNANALAKEKYKNIIRDGQKTKPNVHPSKNDKMFLKQEKLLSDYKKSRSKSKIKRK